MNAIKTGYVGLAAAGVAVLGLAACGTTTGNDAGIKERIHGKRLVVDMPDGYPNIAAACVRGNLVFVVSTTAPATVIANSPLCDNVADGEIGTPKAR